MDSKHVMPVYLRLIFVGQKKKVPSISIDHKFYVTGQQIMRA